VDQNSERENRDLIVLVVALDIVTGQRCVAYLVVDDVDKVDEKHDKPLELEVRVENSC